MATQVMASFLVELAIVPVLAAPASKLPGDSIQAHT